MVWTEKEIEKYRKKRIINPLLSTAYLQLRIPANDPGRRFKYLSEDLLKLTIIEEEEIMHITKKKGKVHALITLEKAFSESY